jgi:hypothetical protein
MSHRGFHDAKNSGFSTIGKTRALPILTTSKCRTTPHLAEPVQQRHSLVPLGTGLQLMQFSNPASTKNENNARRLQKN